MILALALTAAWLLSLRACYILGKRYGMGVAVDFHLGLKTAIENLNSVELTTAVNEARASSSDYCDAIILAALIKNEKKRTKREDDAKAVEAEFTL